ncbi:MAG: hypothetical protein ABID87_05845 [Chloroflexota bacterium]
MSKPQAVRPGYYAAISLVPGTAPTNCYIGLIMEADEYGVRINLVHWDDDLDMVARDTEDLFLPWPSINSMLVCNEDQPSRRFLVHRAPAWRSDVRAMHGGFLPQKPAREKESREKSAKKEKD